jgi:hypothetical protein
MEISLKHLKELLEKEGIKSIIYPAGKYWCLDIEGKVQPRDISEKLALV